MTITRSLAIVVLFALTAPVPAQEGGKKLYCWEENGRKICGDALPAEAAGTARTEFSARSGRRTGQVGPALSEGERAAVEAAEAEAARAAAEEQARIRRELAMVESYATEDELRRAFQARITLLDETVKASRLGVDGLRQSLISQLRRAGELELAGKPVPKTLADNIRHQYAALRRQERMLVQQVRDRAELDGELVSALERYRELKRQAVEAAAAAPASPSGGGQTP